MKEVIVLCVLIVVVCTLMDKLWKRLGWTPNRGEAKSEQVSTNQSGSVQMEVQRIDRTDEQIKMLRNGYKENFDNEIFAPDTVWAGPRSKVYHCLDCCVDGIVIADGIPMPESEALRRGLRRCKKCDWGNIPIPSPGKKPITRSKPISRASVKTIK